MSENDENGRAAKYVGHSFSERAYNRLRDAKRQYDEHCYPEAISSCQEVIELSVKAIFHFAGVKYPKEHKFLEDNFRKVLEKIRERTKEWAPPDEKPYPGVVERVFVFSMFWASMYEYAKYGIEKFGVGPEEIFKGYEADLALKHAYDAYNLARMLYTVFGEVPLKESHYTLFLREPDFNPYST